MHPKLSDNLAVDTRSATPADLIVAAPRQAREAQGTANGLGENRIDPGHPAACAKRARSPNGSLSLGLIAEGTAMTQAVPLPAADDLRVWLGVQPILEPTPAM